MRLSGRATVQCAPPRRAAPTAHAFRSLKRVPRCRPMPCRAVQVWHWTRPFGRGREHSGCSRRVPLSPDAAYLSMGKFLELSFAAGGCACI